MIDAAGRWARFPQPPVHRLVPFLGIVTGDRRGTAAPTTLGFLFPDRPEWCPVRRSFRALSLTFVAARADAPSVRAARAPSARGACLRAYDGEGRIAILALRSFVFLPLGAFSLGALLKFSGATRRAFVAQPPACAATRPSRDAKGKGATLPLRARPLTRQKSSSPTVAPSKKKPSSPATSAVKGKERKDPAAEPAVPKAVTPKTVTPKIAKSPKARATGVTAETSKDLKRKELLAKILTELGELRNELQAHRGMLDTLVKLQRQGNDKLEKAIGADTWAEVEV